MKEKGIVKVDICVCGHFADGLECFDGQTIKTRQVYNLLKKKRGEECVETIDSYGWKKHPIKVLKQCIFFSKISDNIIVLPAHRGVKVFVPLFVWLKKRYDFKLHYIVIGGWLYEKLKNDKRLLKKMKEVDCIYVETNRLIRKLNNLGIKNTFHMVNFKDLSKRNACKVELSRGGLRCCIFSRVEEEKGVLDAIGVIKKYNLINDNKITLDIYGRVKDGFEEKFNNAISGNEYVRYFGPVKPEKSVDVIGQYDLLLFPTKYKTEGVPGTIIDAYFAGVPVLVSNWENCDEIVNDNKTGFSYKFGNINDFYDKLVFIAKNKKMIEKMRNNCLCEADKYLPDNATGVLFDNLRKKILLYIDSMRRGGAERVMSILANSFVEEGHEVILVTDVPVEKNEDNYEISEKIKCIQIKPNFKNYLLKNVQRVKQLRRLIKKEKVDVALSFLGRQNYRMLIATLGLRCRKCVSVRNDPNREYGKTWLKKRIANRIFVLADICVFQTEDAKKYFNKKVQKKAVIIPNPIDEKFFMARRAKNPKNIITVGRLEPQKNQKILIDAFTAIADKIGDEKLLIYGDGSLKGDLRKYIEKIGMSDRIIMMGEVDKIERELAKAKLFVLSSDYEGMPNALMEAMAVGLPCVATDCPCGGPKQLFDSSRENMLVPCDNVKKMSQAILFFMNGMNKDEDDATSKINEYRCKKVAMKWGNVLGLSRE